MKKNISVLLTLFLVFVLAACGSPATETAIEEPAVATEAAMEEPVEETGPRSITFFTTEADPPQLEILGVIIDEYNEMHPDVFIDVVTGTPATRGNRITTLLAAGADAGIFELEAAFTNDWAEAGFLLPLTDVFENIGGVDEYVPGSYFETDEVYGLPYATSVYGLWIRTDLFEEAGLDVPTNYAEVLAAAEALTNPAEGIYGISICGSRNCSVNLFSTMLWQQGGDYYTPQGELIFDSPEALAAVENWVALTKFSPPGFEGYSWGDQITAYVSGSAAMTVYAGRLGVRMPEQAPQLEAVSDIIQLPWNTGDGPYVTYGSWSRMAISAGTQYPETAKDFLQFLLSGDRLARYDATVIGHMVPPTKSVAAMLEGWDSDYANNHSDWLAFFNANAEFTNHPANNMGSVGSWGFEKNDYGPPWGGPIFSSGGILDIMFQSIYVDGVSAEDAHQEALGLMKEVQDEWLADHPDWTAPS
ncbi:MAG: extracellular solute-binding protein [Anaerolineae bacterium]|nr:extracellular solute-binding protein [Anaerolineae bacterium]MDK1081384.1 extracellular solute-binding protein [Anaerolineae bacterium]MDK1119153.1 extracellular solute-binding protein [Anaerolineae bacterium]